MHTMFPSSIVSKSLRLVLLSVFCAGLFVSVGEVNIGSKGGVSLGNGGINAVWAADPPAGGATTGDTTKSDSKETTNDVMKGLTDFANVIIKLLSIFLAPLIMLAGWLLSPDWTFGDIIGLRPILHQIWVLISNIVYVIFGFMLVGIAFANIFG